MSLQDWVDETQARFNREGVVTSAYGSLQELYEGGLGKVGEYVYNYGTPVWEREWDVLILLDTCRPDVLGEVAPQYDFLSGYDQEHDQLSSVGSRSPEWIRKTFHKKWETEMSETAYISANPHTRDIPNPSALGLLDEVWEYAWSEECGNVPPENLTDRAISVGREHDFDRMIVHYMQPHAPYPRFADPDWAPLSVGLDNPQDKPEMDMWERLRTGRLSKEEAWSAYRETLTWVIDDGVVPLLSNMDADTVAISSDHGEAFGDWWYYGHSTPAPIPPLKEVPWALTTAEDQHTILPTIVPMADVSEEQERNEKLKALGYQ